MAKYNEDDVIFAKCYIFYYEGFSNLYKKIFESSRYDEEIVTSVGKYRFNGSELVSWRYQYHDYIDLKETLDEARELGRNHIIFIGDSIELAEYKLRVLLHEIVTLKLAFKIAFNVLKDIADSTKSVEEVESEFGSQKDFDPVKIVTNIAVQIEERDRKSRNGREIN